MQSATACHVTPVHIAATGNVAVLRSGGRLSNQFESHNLYRSAQSMANNHSATIYHTPSSTWYRFSSCLSPEYAVVCGGFESLIQRQDAPDRSSMSSPSSPMLPVAEPDFVTRANGLDPSERCPGCQKSRWWTPLSSYQPTLPPIAASKASIRSALSSSFIAQPWLPSGQGIPEANDAR